MLQFEIHEDHLDWEAIKAEYDKLPDREKLRWVAAAPEVPPSNRYAWARRTGGAAAGWDPSVGAAALHAYFWSWRPQGPA